MKRTYQVISRKEANDAGISECNPDEDRGEVLVEAHDGVPQVVLGFDRGEPEDNCFYRDWSWVAPALNAAYQQGLVDAEVAQ